MSEEKLARTTELAERTGQPVDPIDLSTVGESVLEKIIQHGEKLRGSETCYAGLVRRHLFDQAEFFPYRRRILS